MKFLLFFLNVLLLTVNIEAGVQQKTEHYLHKEEGAVAATQLVQLVSNTRHNLHANSIAYDLSDEIGEMVSFPTPDDKPANAYFIKAQKESDNYLFVFHEWWGLNDYIKQEAEKLYKNLEDVNVLAIDLYDGKLADQEEQATELMESLDEERAEDIIRGAVEFASKNARISTIGWGLGGSWSLQAAMIAGAHSVACVMFYGEPEGDKDKLKMLQAPVLAIYGSQDDSIPQDDLDEFEEEMEEVEKELALKMFDADHAFANADNSGFNDKAAEKAYKKALKFLKKGFDSGYF